MSLAAEASDDIVWTGAGRYGNLIVAFVASVVLTRLLTPEDYGLVAMVQALCGFLFILANPAFAPAIVQFRHLRQRDLSTVFWLGISLGGLFSILFAASSMSIARFYGLPRVRAVAMALALGFLFSSVGIVPRGLLRQQMSFRRIAIAEVTSALVANALAIGLAVFGYGYWALVASSLLGRALTSALLLSMAQWRPTFVFDAEMLRQIFSFSGHVTLFNLITYWIRTLDSILIGRFLGSSALGYYNRAFALMSFPANISVDSINPVVHPALASIQTDLPRLYRAYLRLMKLAAITSFPLLGVLVVMAPELVRTVWGARWMNSVPVFRILCLAAAIQPVVSMTSSAFLACRRADLLCRVWGVNALIICAGIVGGLSWGIAGVAAGYSIGYCAIVFPTLYIVIVKLLGGSMRDLVRVLKSPVLVSTIVAVLVLLVKVMTLGRLAAPIELAIGILCAMLAYMFSMYWLDRGFLREIYKVSPVFIQRRVDYLSRYGFAID